MLNENDVLENYVVEAGKDVEVITLTPGCVTSYYPAKCLEICGEKCRVKHYAHRDDKGFFKIEDLPLDMVRPEAPLRHFDKFVPGDEVDCIYAGGWWKCKVRHEGSRNTIWVSFEHPLGDKTRMQKKQRDLRIHHEWSRHNPTKWEYKKLSETGSASISSD